LEVEGSVSDETFGQRLKRLRQSKKLKSRDVANHLGITLPYFSQMEADLAVPSEELARKIAIYFDENEEDFVFLARRMHKQISDIVQRFPRVAPAYFRRVMKEQK
jgi:transcriptional regulator with XRE-family HTH domain